MKLISLYIEAFGKIENLSYNFNSGLNTFLEENGFGKTTLCNFIKMMFYGSGKNSKDIDKSDKTKYMPWSGNKYGGNLVFEVNGKRYKVIRNFLKKNDDFKLYDLNTNKESKDYSSNLGEEIFGVNVTSFEESIYIPQKDLIVGFGNDISSKLANVVISIRGGKCLFTPRTGSCLFCLLLVLFTYFLSDSLQASTCRVLSAGASAFPKHLACHAHFGPLCLELS